MIARLLAASALVVGLAGCSSTAPPGAFAAFGGPPDGVAEAKQFRCPTASSVEQVTGMRMPAPDRSTFKNLSVMCSYFGPPNADASLTASITFGAGSTDLEAMKRLLPSAKVVDVPGLGDGAFETTDRDGTRTLFVRFGDRLVSIIEDSPANRKNPAALARLFG